MNDCMCKYAVIDYNDQRTRETYAVKLSSYEALSATKEKLRQVLELVCDQIIGSRTGFKISFTSDIRNRGLSFKHANKFSHELFGDNAIYVVWEIRPELYTTDEIKEHPEYELIAEI